MSTGFTPPYPKRQRDSKGRSLWALFRKGRQSFLHTLFEESYQNDISKMRFPRGHLVMVKMPELIQRVLVKDWEKFPKHEMMGRVLGPLLGESIITTNGATWERQRAMMDPAFEQAGLKSVFPLMREGANALIDRLDQQDDGKITDVQVEMTNVTADIIMRTILSVSLESRTAQEIFKAFNRYSRKASFMMLLEAIHVPSWFFPVDVFVWKRSGRKIRKLLTAIIQPRYEAYQESGDDPESDILSSLLKARDPKNGTPFSFKELVDQVAVLFFAGHETSASALSWSLYLIANCPDIQNQIYEEAEGILEGGEPDFKNLSKHKRCREVFRESLRLYPPVAFFIRRSTEATCIHAKEVEVDSTVVVSPWLTHRHRKLWDRPDEFDPDRFSDRPKEQHQCSFIPFGAGPRSCIGAAFAMQEAMLILIRLVRRFEFEAIPDHEPRAAAWLTVRSTNGIHLRIRKRKRPVDLQDA